MNYKFNTVSCTQKPRCICWKDEYVTFDIHKQEKSQKQPDSSQTHLVYSSCPLPVHISAAQSWKSNTRLLNANSHFSHCLTTNGNLNEVYKENSFPFFQIICQYIQLSCSRRGTSYNVVLMGSASPWLYVYDCINMATTQHRAYSTMLPRHKKHFYFRM